MMRIKNEQRWIRRSLERTWEICEIVGVLDDGSTDATFDEAVASLGAGVDVRAGAWGNVATASGKTLYFWRSPFVNADVRPEERVNEIRDKNTLYSLMKSNVPFD